MKPEFNVVLIIPTGIGWEIGGHAGDANPVAKLLGSICDNLILHPNVVNASDINEMPENALYVEGSILDRFLEGEIELQKIRSNKILIAANEPLHSVTINAASAARATIGANVEIIGLDPPLQMEGRVLKDGRAVGAVSDWQHAVQQIEKYEFDALALHTYIKVDDEVRLNYYENGGTNPWGFVEAMASKLMADRLDKPVAHAPCDPIEPLYDKIVDPRLSAEMVSCSFLHCILKGLHQAPRIGKGLSVEDIDCLISPWACVGIPHKACLKKGIPVIAVKENRTVLNDTMPNEFIFVENYLEAMGHLIAMREGVAVESIRRPIEPTKILQ